MSQSKPNNTIEFIAFEAVAMAIAEVVPGLKVDDMIHDVDVATRPLDEMAEAAE